MNNTSYLVVFVFFTSKDSFSLPVDIQYTQSPCRSFLLERCKLCGEKKHDTEILYYVLECSKQSRQCNDVRLHWIRQVRQQF